MNSMSKMKVLVLVPIGGLANRFYAILSAMGSGFMSFGLKIGGWGLTFILY